MDTDTPTLAPPTPDSTIMAHFQTADRLHREGELRQSAEELKQALQINPASPEAHYNLANVVRDAGELALAAQGYRAALRCARLKRHVYPDALINLGDVLNRMGRYDTAMVSLREAKRLQPTRLEPRIGLSHSFEGLGNLSAAIKNLQHAIDLKPEVPGLHLHMGVLRHWSGRYAEALESFDRAIALQPDFAEAHVEKGRTLLTIGHVREGFAETEWRWKTAALAGHMQAFTVPAWDGTQALKGKAVLVHGSRVFADTIQFVRYVPLLAARGAKVVLAVDEPLRLLMQTLPGVTAICGPDDLLPVHDYHVSVLSLPYLLEQIPTQPYLKAEAGMAQGAAERLPAGRKIGVAPIGTSGGPRQPEIRLADLAVLSTIPDATLVHLQQTEPDQQGLPGMTMPGGLPDFGRAAALIANLDLVISADNAVAQLAAAMGKRVILLLPAQADWRWGASGATSPWYPTIRILRQARKGDWTTVLKRAVALAGTA
jgi:Tfp pilus assembly protein PilF